MTAYIVRVIPRITEARQGGTQSHSDKSRSTAKILVLEGPSGRIGRNGNGNGRRSERDGGAFKNSIAGYRRTLSIFHCSTDTWLGPELPFRGCIRMAFPLSRFHCAHSCVPAAFAKTGLSNTIFITTSTWAQLARPRGVNFRGGDHGFLSNGSPAKNAGCKASRRALSVKNLSQKEEGDDGMLMVLHTDADTP